MIELFNRHGVPITTKVIEGKPGQYTTMGWKACGRCGGAGGSDMWKHTGWTCFQCGGSKGHTIEVKCYTAEKLAKLNATKAKADAAKAAKSEAARLAAKAEHDAVIGAFMAEHGALVEAARTLASSSGSPFLNDLVAKLEGKTWTDNQINAVRNVVEKFAATAAKKASSEYVGSVGDRLTIEVTVENLFQFERPCFNASWLKETVNIVTMRDAAGNALVSKGKFWAEKGEAFTIKGTVKAHGEYKGEKQTTLQRVTVPTRKEKQ